MKKLFEFQCSNCNEIFEELTEYKKVTRCPWCDSDADKIISAPRVSLEGISGAFPGASWAWEKKHKIKPTQDD